MYGLMNDSCLKQNKTKQKRKKKHWKHNDRIHTCCVSSNKYKLKPIKSEATKLMFLPNTMLSVNVGNLKMG